ncbi:hypothetical protein PL75_01095 [Neisseria arctica]|uniref:Uncharacterized protein n=1 Tax=Neisseria arctica TaxID=1470200 RepID=A0A0J1C5H9_9NEIS|nr:hypothetical protein PL75_01095 [Neisseria arctica]
MSNLFFLENKRTKSVGNLKKLQMFVQALPNEIKLEKTHRQYKTVTLEGYPLALNLTSKLCTR